jgi:hypothetical protein
MRPRCASGSRTKAEAARLSVCAELRRCVPGLAADHYLWPEFTMAVELLRDGRIVGAARAVVSELR